MKRLTELPPVGRVVLTVALTILAMTLAITLENRERARSAAAPTPVAADPHRASLGRCRALGEAAVNDPACQSTWAENRARFFGSAQDEGTQ